MLLALDTSTHFASLALCESGELRAEYIWDVGTNHSVELLQRLERFLQEHGLSMTQLSAVATTTGPGSFTGVRVAVTVAKTLAFSLKVPLVGISTLDVMAYSHAAAALPVCALLEAGRGEFYAARYRQFPLSEAAQRSGALDGTVGAGAWIARVLPADGSRTQDGLYWQRQSEYQVVTAEELGQEIQEPMLLCGELRPDSRRKLAGVLGPWALFARPLACLKRASLLAELAFQRLEQGEQDDPLTLEPLYLRRPAITVSARQRPQLLGHPGGTQTLPNRQDADAASTARNSGPGEQRQEDPQSPSARSQSVPSGQGASVVGDLRGLGADWWPERQMRLMPGSTMIGQPRRFS